MPQKRKNAATTISAEFRYAILDAKVAEQIRAAADTIREKVKRTIDNIIEVGHALLKVKDALPHGQFGPWLALEFGWATRTARRFMDVAEVFGTKTDIMADLPIAPTAAYLLAAPSTPFEARQIALERAKSRETITAAVAQEIVGTLRKKASRKGHSAPAAKMRLRFERMLGRFREQWNLRERSELAKHLRKLANELEKGKSSEGKTGTA